MVDTERALGTCTTELFDIEYRIAAAPDWMRSGRDEIELFLRLVSDPKTAAIRGMVQGIEMPAELPWRRDAPPSPMVLPENNTGFCTVGLVEPPAALPHITIDDGLNPVAARCFVDALGYLFVIDFFPRSEVYSVGELLLQSAALTVQAQFAD